MNRGGSRASPSVRRGLGRVKPRIEQSPKGNKSHHAHDRIEEWGEIFGDELMAAAFIDRLVHHCHIVNIRRNSYRLRQHAELARSLQAGAEPTPPPTKEGRRR